MRGSALPSCDRPGRRTRKAPTVASGSGKPSSHTILHLSGLSLAGRDDQPRHRVSRARCGNHRPGARTILCVSTLQKGDGCADHQTSLQTTMACGLSCPRHARVGRNPRSLAALPEIAIGSRSSAAQVQTLFTVRLCRRTDSAKESRSQAHPRDCGLPIDAGLAKACHCHQGSCASLEIERGLHHLGAVKCHGHSPPCAPNPPRFPRR